MKWQRRDRNDGAPYDVIEIPFRGELTALIPIDLHRRPIELLNRCRTLIEQLLGLGIHVVLSHNDRSSKADENLKKICTHITHPSFRLASTRGYDGVSNSGLLRNRGMTSVVTPFCVLLDIDIVPDSALLARLLEVTRSGAEPFAMAPCLYLSRVGTERFRRERNVEAMHEAYFGFEMVNFQHLAWPSSVMLFSVEHFNAIGGFHEAFEGHGYEDFDFMLRLALSRGVLNQDCPLFPDATYRAPLLVEGFRAALATHCVSRLLEGHIALHLFHEKVPGDAYYEKRKANAELFRSRLTGLTKPEYPWQGRGRPLWMANYFYDVCEKRGIDARKYTAMFDARPVHLNRRSGVRERLPGVVAFAKRVISGGA